MPAIPILLFAPPGIVGMATRLRPFMGQLGTSPSITFLARPLSEEERIRALALVRRHGDGDAHDRGTWQQVELGP